MARNTQRILMEKIKETLPAEDAALFKQSRTAMAGTYGRLAYVYCDFFGKKIAVYQPGSFRIESAVKFGSKLAIIDNNGWANGFVLSLEHSLFLCKFLAALTNNAKKISATPDKLDEKTYISALTNTMQQFVFDDCLKYGCLIELKNGLDLVFE